MEPGAETGKPSVILGVNLHEYSRAPCIFENEK
jgi:hypothetical protein